MERELIIVESPTKAKTISGILGNKYLVFPTMGHIRDLPENEFGINIDDNFSPKYVIIPGKKKIVEKLKNLAKNSTNIYLATDEDREGEAIAWHVVCLIDKKIEEAKRVTFHEIVPEAIKKAFLNPRQISIELVNAQQARRILDRIVGYKISPILGKHLEIGLSAGRVQSVALKLIVEREKEIENFVPEIYFVIRCEVEKNGEKIIFNLIKIEEISVGKERIKDEQKVDEIIEKLKQGKLIISEKEEMIKKLSSVPPFITSTLQQEAINILNFSSTKTMFIAQQLYEGIKIEDKNIGLITYMRTDSPSVAKSAQNQALKFIKENFGENYLPEKPNIYYSKSKVSQEAHEAIRPTSVYRTPEKIKKYLTQDQFKLYELIWRRFLASQMAPAIIKNIKVFAFNDIYLFETERDFIVFDGFLRLWPLKIEKGNPIIEKFEKGEELNVIKYLKEKKQTQPPPRYTESTLIKTLEKYGIGRPSTYAPTISTLYERNYVKREKKFLVPLKMGKIVYEILNKFFPEIIEINFTAKMEEDLDKIANGEKNWIEVLKEFYNSFKLSLEKANEIINRDVLNKIIIGDKKCPLCNGELTIIKGKYGIFIGCSNYPNCKYKERIRENVNNSSNRSKKR
ncbi:MAG: type I DNA topoisomerase [Candidatus Omnitrophica bacterium]|nr:type I DNA topoisomerase [Candidatus Omnitrophota bacterium]MCM8801748.1 type I DNA topoisomerase [Candidatus Omnitrophota bacterium]